MIELSFAIVIVLVIWFISYNLFSRDIMAPSFLLCTGYLLSLVSALYNINFWNASVGIYTVFVYITGILSFLAGSLFIKRFKPRRESRIDYRAVEFHEIKIGFVKYIFCVVSCIVILHMTYQEVIRIANIHYVDRGNLIYNFKNNIINNELENASISSLVMQLNKITKGLAFVFLYVFLNNLFVKKISLTEKIANFKYLIPGIIYIFQCTIKGGRFTSIAFLIAGIFMFYFFWRINEGWEKAIKFKYIFLIITIIIAVFAWFWFSRELVGRMATDTSAIGYLTRYLGGEIYNFDMYLNDPKYLHDGVHETFASMIISFNKLGLSEIPYRFTHEFRMSPNGIIIGNAHSALRNYYHDFGLIGVSVMNLLLAAVFGGIYDRMKTNITAPNKNIFMLILYSSFIYAVLFQCFGDYLFARLSLGLFVEILVMWLCYFYVLRMKFIDFKVNIIRV